MKIAILSDTHNQLARTGKALELARVRGAEMILHCGDIEDPPVVSLFAGWQAHFVFGNCDYDRVALADAIKDIGATLHPRYGHLELQGKKIAFLHGHEERLLDDLVGSEAYDYLFHGHTHVAKDEKTGATRVINPGALHRVQVKTFLLLEPATGKSESIPVD